MFRGLACVFDYGVFLSDKNVRPTGVQGKQIVGLGLDVPIGLIKKPPVHDAGS